MKSAAFRRIAGLGLTGGIGSGKSTAARVLVSCGAHLVDTDAIARALTQAGGAAIPALRVAFGEGALNPDGGLSREHMRRLAFDDPGAKSRLESILHPLIGAEASQQAARAAGRPVVFDVPLLAESGRSGTWRARVERILVVDCSERTQIERVTRRPGWNEELARRVIAQQASRAERRALADAVIDNDATPLESFEAEVRALWCCWFDEAA